MNPELVAKIQEWEQLVEEIQVFKDTRIAREMILRKELASILFPDPREGVNHLPLESGWEMKLDHKLTRKVDEEKLEVAILELQTRFGVSTNKLIRRKPEVVLGEYRELTEDQRKVLDQALEIKPSTPTLELVPPKGV